MKDLAFFDTNLLLYADDEDQPEKQERAIQLIAVHVRQNTAVLSLQVLQEYFAIATRKLKISSEKAQRKVEAMAKCRIVRFSPDDVIAGIELHRLHKISFWDALIIHAARMAGAPVLFSEDLHSGSKIGGVRIVNPFIAPTS